MSTPTNDLFQSKDLSEVERFLLENLPEVAPMISSYVQTIRKASSKTTPRIHEACIQYTVRDDFKVQRTFFIASHQLH